MLWKLQHRLQQFQTDWGDLACVYEHMRHKISLTGAASPVVYAFAGYGNAGDHVSHLGVRRLVGQPGASRLFDHRVANGLGSSSQRHLVIGGGGLLQPVFEHAWRSVIDSGCSFSIIGVGLAETPPHRPALNKDLLQDIASSCRFALLRDQMSAEAFRAVGGECEVSFCPGLLELQQVQRPGDARRSLLLHVIHPSDLRLAGHNIDVVRKAAERFAESRSLRYVELDHASPYSKKLVSLYDQASICVSSRLHGCLLAYARGVECLPLICDRKTLAFYKTHACLEQNDLAGDFFSPIIQTGIQSCAGASIDRTKAIVEQLEQVAKLHNERLTGFSIA